MNRNMKIAAIAALGALAVAAFATPADAQGRSRQTTVKGENGRTATSSRMIERADGTRTKTGSVQTGEGYGASRTVNSGIDQENGERFRSGSTTTNSGATVSSGSAASCDNGACGRNSYVTGPNGETVNGSTVRYVDENGNLVKESGVTGPDGQTASRDVTRDGEGTKTTTRTNAQGEESSRTRWVTVQTD